MKRPFRVCLVIEGSYPFTTGGVSAWVHELILGMPDVEFSLLTISPVARQQVRYPLPSNVTDLVDIVLDSAPGTGQRNPKIHDLVREVERVHDQAFAGTVMDLDAMIRHMPEDYSLSRDALKREDFWQLIVDRNADVNPLYPFSDYLWNWKSSHEMMFKVLGTPVPEADVYHAVSTGFAGLAALAAKIRRGKPMLLTEHGLYHRERAMEIRKADYFQGYQRDHWTKIYDQISQACYQQADLVTALFEYNRQEQIRMGARPERTKVVPNGIDVARFSGVERKPRPGFHVGLVGRVVPIKDIKTFILTAKTVAALVPEAHFYCVGPTDEDPEYYEECLRLTRSLGMAKQLTFTGRQDVLDFYAFLDVLVLTSIREAQPLAILEAWCAGIPVVATRVGDVPEMLSYDDRFLADPKDAQTLARNILWIRNSPEEVRPPLAAFRKKTTELHNRARMLETLRSHYELLGGTTWRA